MRLIQKIKVIGHKGFCDEEDLMTFLPNYPKLLGDEYIFNIKLGEIMFELKTNENISLFIKGLHYIELEYRKITNDNFGFGSPSSTSRLLNNIFKKEPELSSTLTNWIKNNGGNYYIR